MKDIINTQRVYLKAESIHRFLSGDHDELDTLIMCQTQTRLVTTDQSLYEALGSFKDKTQINLNKLVKLLEMVRIESFEQAMKKPRTILKDVRVNEILDRSKEA